MTKQHLPKPHDPSGVTDKAADNAHDFIETTEAQEHKLHPDAQLDRGEAKPEASEGLGSQDASGGQSQGQQKSKMDTIKEALHLKK
ncbi:hypothetical protein MAPG_06029 [Magnaporthiopsis poae ATCC 64411]|uniref:Uncharacterized protein n=1 Tax=Magnaporthiopsis poae (strain ATCC 64411 / 73-15) TaxID=644358 RepID=A0A0C4E0Y7_MAGP6|nr:hypothetical protein MAPG_06029 [Magnaporthiopsis poae ATCC 64411]